MSSPVLRSEVAHPFNALFISTQRAGARYDSKRGSRAFYQTALTCGPVLHRAGSPRLTTPVVTHPLSDGPCHGLLRGRSLRLAIRVNSTWLIIHLVSPHRE